MQNRPYTTAILAMTVDGKIADATRQPARFGSRADKVHLEKQIADADAVIFGAGTLRAYGTTLTVSHLNLLQHREKMGKTPQPLHIVITNSGQLNPEIRFFQQPVRRYLVTTSTGARIWEERLELFQQQYSQEIYSPLEDSPLEDSPLEDYPEEYFDQENFKLKYFEQILVFETPMGTVDIVKILEHLRANSIEKLAVLGGGTLVALMLELNLIDEFWLTVCPLILGGSAAPTPVDGKGFLPNLAPRLQLLEVCTVEQEVFLHYRVRGYNGC